MVRKIWITAAAALALHSCEDTTVIRDSEGVNSWVYNTMKENYLWSSAIPPKHDTDLSMHPETYFNDVLRYKRESAAPGNDIFSYIKYTGSENDYPSVKSASTERVVDFGLEVRISVTINGYCQVLSVVPGSPAWEAGIRRGYCFDRIDGSPVNSVAHYRSLMSQNSVELHFFYPADYSAAIYKNEYTDDPVIFDTVYSVEPRTGYIVYNHFTAGSGNRNFHRLKKVFARFRDEGITNLIVDLRYNGGGELEAARQLASLVVPQDFLGQLFLYEEKNYCYGDKDLFEALHFLSGGEAGAYNPDIKNLFFLTSFHTASASELLIHCLKPHFKESGGKVTVVGNITYGKNVGGISITNRRYEWELHPITLRVYDKYKVSGYENGIVPDYFDEETYPLMATPSGHSINPIGDFGDVKNERLLRRAMKRIYGSLDWAEPDPHETTETGLFDRIRELPIQEPTRSSGKADEYTIRQRGLYEGLIIVE